MRKKRKSDLSSYDRTVTFIRYIYFRFLELCNYVYSYENFFVILNEFSSHYVYTQRRQKWTDFPLIKPKKTRKGFVLLEVNFVMSQIEIPLCVV